MWICIMGPRGSCRDKVAGYLAEKEGFTREEVWHTDKLTGWTTNGDPFWDFYCRLLDHYTLQRRIEKTMQDRVGSRLVSIGSVWEEYEVGARTEMKYLHKDRYRRLGHLYNKIMEFLPPPDVFIRMKVDFITVHNRLSLAGGDNVSDDALAAQFKNLDRLVDKIRVPVIEVDAGEDFKLVEDDVKHGVSTITSSGAGRDSIWTKGVFR